MSQTTIRSYRGAPARGIFRVMTCVTVAMLGAACAPISPSFDANFGRTVPQITAAQTANPGASVANQNKPVTGLDGRAARESMERYYNSFKVPPPPGNTFVIGVGGGVPGAAQ